MSAVFPTTSMQQQVDDVDKALTNEIFSILENKFLFGINDHHHENIPNNAYSIFNDRQSTNSKVRILSIDAGGSTDGLLAANTLLHLQSTLRRKSENPTAHIADFFDVATGAGVGGILAGMLFTRGKDGAPIFTAEESLQFVIQNAHKFADRGTSCRPNFLRRTSRPPKALNKVFGNSTLRDTLKAVLIPCYDLSTGAPFLFSRADAMEMDGCDFVMADVCAATISERAVELRSTDGMKKMVAVGGGVAMSNPTAAAITHVLNNKREFPICKGVEDLLVVSLGNGECDSTAGEGMSSPSTMLKIAGDGAADMVDQAVSMAFGEWRRSNYVRIQGNAGIMKRERRGGRGALLLADDMLGQKNVECSTLFEGKRLGEKTNMEKIEIITGELVKEQHRRNLSFLPTVVLKHHQYSPPRSSSATTLSTLSSN